MLLACSPRSQRCLRPLKPPNPAKTLREALREQRVSMLHCTALHCNSHKYFRPLGNMLASCTPCCVICCDAFSRPRSPRRKDTVSFCLCWCCRCYEMEQSPEHPHSQGLPKLWLCLVDGCGCAGAPAKKEKKPRKKKDPNAPKKALSAFMYFSNANRERVKTSNPGIPFGQVGLACCRCRGTMCIGVLKRMLV